MLGRAGGRFSTLELFLSSAAHDSHGHSVVSRNFSLGDLMFEPIERLKQQLADGELAIGTSLAIADPLVSEALADSMASNRWL